MYLIKVKCMCMCVLFGKSTCLPAVMLGSCGELATKARDRFYSEWLTSMTHCESVRACACVVMFLMYMPGYLPD